MCALFLFGVWQRVEVIFTGTFVNHGSIHCLHAVEIHTISGNFSELMVTFHLLGLVVVQPMNPSSR